MGLLCRYQPCFSINNNGMHTIKKRFLTAFICVTVTGGTALAQAPKVVADCTVKFDVSFGGGGSVKASKTVYIKGYEIRSDMVSPEFTQSTLYNSRQGTAVILREIGSAKYMSTLDAAKWKEFNKRYDGMQVTLSNESKTILGYECKKAVAQLKDGTVLNLYYATAIIPSVSENEYQFKGIPGFVLEYESEAESGKQKISFTATDMNLSPVPAAKFEVPTSGYRIL